MKYSKQSELMVDRLFVPTLDVIQRRYYVRLAAKRFEPTELGEIVNNLIVEFKASALEKDLITTDRKDLQELKDRIRKYGTDAYGRK